MTFHALLRTKTWKFLLEVGVLTIIYEISKFRVIRKV